MHKEIYTLVTWLVVRLFWIPATRRVSRVELNLDLIQVDRIFAKSERNRVGRMVDQATAEFLKEQQNEHADDPKKFWRVVKSIVPGKRKPTSVISLMNNEAVDGEEAISVSGTADFINQFFTGICPKLASNLEEKWSFFGERVQDDCPLFSANFAQVLKLCKEIKTVKSSGFPDISSMVLKDAFLVIIRQLVYLFNLSFATNTFPDRWKKATIIPLFKGGDKTEAGNYRPVSLLPLPGKLLERVAQANLLSFLNDHTVISNKQGGFRKGFSTASTIADLSNMFFANMNDGLTSLAAFIDLWKAFDTVNHVILLKKLYNYGIRGVNFDWCTNYLAPSLGTVGIYAPERMMRRFSKSRYPKLNHTKGQWSIEGLFNGMSSQSRPDL